MSTVMVEVAPTWVLRNGRVAALASARVLPVVGSTYSSVNFAGGVEPARLPEITTAGRTIWKVPEKLPG